MHVHTYNYTSKGQKEHVQLWHTHKHNVRHAVNIDKPYGHEIDDPERLTLRTNDGKTLEEYLKG